MLRDDGWMNVLALAIPLTRLLTYANLCTAAAACRSCLVLNTSTNGQPLFTGDLRLLLVVFAHGSGFPLADAPPHKPGAVGFPNIFPLDKNIQDAHIPSVVIQIKLTASQS